MLRLITAAQIYIQCFVPCNASTQGCLFTFRSSMKWLRDHPLALRALSCSAIKVIASLSMREQQENNRRKISLRSTLPPSPALNTLHYFHEFIPQKGCNFLTICSGFLLPQEDV